MRVLITGSNGFIGKNLQIRLSELSDYSVISFVRGDDVAILSALVAQADVIVHLAGENRPADESAFAQVNTVLTVALCNALRAEAISSGRKLPVLFASSTQADIENPYGRSKLAAEHALHELGTDVGNPIIIFRLPGVFGKWCKPNYNSVVATFCYNLSHGLPVHINDASKKLCLVYIDDVVEALLAEIKSAKLGIFIRDVKPHYFITLGELAHQIKEFDSCRGSTLKTERVGTGLARALYATYISYLPISRFKYELPQHRDSRGVFVEMLKTQDSGQFSYFTAHPGITRGGHYHHSKTEKFLVMKGEALFRFRHLLTNEMVEICTSGERPQVVDTIPGWAHDITNVGGDEMVVMLWANENFVPQRPDTISMKV